MKIKRSILVILLTSSFLAVTSFAAPLLDFDPITHAQRVAKNNAWIEIDDTAITRNIEKLKVMVGTGTKICAIVKADAYGNSIELIMPALINANLPCLGFGSNEEARIARKHGYNGVLMRVRTALEVEVRDGIQYDIEELVGNLSYAQEVAKIAKEMHHPLRIHLAINANGLSRNGIELATEQGRQDALEISKIENLEIVGLMTHYPVEEIDDVKANLELFKQQSTWLIDATNLERNKLTLHAANTFATLEVPESHMDMVRVGGAIYGDLPHYPELERTFAAFKTRVATVNSYPKGNTVGYDRTITLKRDSRLANLPIGYADGYRRAFSNKAFVLINGHRVPVIGKISMNTTMVDVTDFPDIKFGDEVVIFGKQGKDEITQEELEEIQGALLADIYLPWANSNPRILQTQKSSD